MSARSTEPYLATHLHNMGGRLGLPIGGNFELTARCNFSCPMCYVHMNQGDAEAAKRELTAAQWIDIARQARDAGTIFALLTGGEPFIRKDFFEIYHAMKAFGLMISINSNGSMLHGEIRRQLLEDPPFRMNISLYGGCGETYRNMCANDAFETVVDNIRTLKSAGVDVRLNLSITPYNRQDLDKIHRIAQELNVHVKAVSYMYPSVRVNGEQYGFCNRLSAEEAAKCTVEWNRLRLNSEEFAARGRRMEEMMANSRGECVADLEEGVGCRAGHSSFWITWDGRMLPCGMMPGPEAYPALIGFQDAWEQIKEQIKQIRMPAACTSCAKRQVCPVCAAVCVTETGAFDRVPEYVCRQTEETIRLTLEACDETGGESDGH